MHVTAGVFDVKSTPGEITEEGLRANISVGIQYLEVLVARPGAVGISN